MYALHTKHIFTKSIRMDLFFMRKKRFETRNLQNLTKKNFINRLIYSEERIICICIDVYGIFECEDLNKIFEVLSRLKNKKVNTEEFENDIIMVEGFEQNHYSRAEKIIYNIGHHIRLLKCMAYYESYFEKIQSFNLLASVLSIFQ